jgi:hypothetical protein
MADKLAVERAVALAEQMRASSPNKKLDPAAEARRIAQELLGADASPVRSANRTPPRVPPNVAEAVAAARSPGSTSASAVAAAAKARAIALSMRQEAVAAQREPSPDRNHLLWEPKAVRISGLLDPAAAMNGDYRPERAKGTPANRSLAWRAHNGRAAYFGKMAVLYFDGAASWKLGPELGSSQCCCFGTDSMADKPEQVAPGSWKVWRDGQFQTQEDLLVEAIEEGEERHEGVAEAGVTEAEAEAAMASEAEAEAEAEKEVRIDGLAPARSELVASELKLEPEAATEPAPEVGPEKNRPELAVEPKPEPAPAPELEVQAQLAAAEQAETESVAANAEVERLSAEEAEQERVDAEMPEQERIAGAEPEPEPELELKPEQEPKVTAQLQELDTRMAEAPGKHTLAPAEEAENDSLPASDGAAQEPCGSEETAEHDASKLTQRRRQRDGGKPDKGNSKSNPLKWLLVSTGTGVLLAVIARLLLGILRRRR